MYLQNQSLSKRWLGVTEVFYFQQRITFFQAIVSWAAHQLVANVFRYVILVHNSQATFNILITLYISQASMLSAT